MSNPAESIWLFDSGQAGPDLAISFGVHGNERPPIDAGLKLVGMLEAGELTLAAGRLLVVWGNPLASGEDTRWSQGGIDLNRCFSNEVLGRAPELYEERRAREITRCLEDFGATILVDFHCTVEPGDPFLMHHPPIAHEATATVARLLSAKVVLADPALNFGGVSLDEWMSTRDRVGICYETGWIQSPECTPEFVLDEMLNVLAGNCMIASRDPVQHADKRLLQLDEVIRCEAEGFRWKDGIGENLQELTAGTELGAYGDGTAVKMPLDATLIFPKKKPELVAMGKPLVYLGVRKD